MLYRLVGISNSVYTRLLLGLTRVQTQGYQQKVLADLTSITIIICDRLCENLHSACILSNMKFKIT